jgi:L-alanine-DL-glutamate epimerase-like enolase superfamily enzyme
MVALPGTATIRDGHVRPSDAPGFGFEISREWLEQRSTG